MDIRVWASAAVGLAAANGRNVKRWAFQSEKPKRTRKTEPEHVQASCQQPVASERRAAWNMGK